MSTVPEETPREPVAQHVVAQTTVDTPAVADQLARRVVEARLAACVQISAVRSVFSWEGAVKQEPEQLLAMKTTASAVADLRALLDAEHPYDEPELVVLPIVDGSPSYLNWVRESVDGG